MNAFVTGRRSCVNLRFTYSDLWERFLWERVRDIYGRNFPPVDLTEFEAQWKEDHADAQ
jgi:hypothetical protein